MPFQAYGARPTKIPTYRRGREPRLQVHNVLPQPVFPQNETAQPRRLEQRAATRPRRARMRKVLKCAVLYRRVRNPRPQTLRVQREILEEVLPKFQEQTQGNWQWMASTARGRPPIQKPPISAYPFYKPESHERCKWQHRQSRRTP